MKELALETIENEIKRLNEISRTRALAPAEVKVLESLIKSRSLLLAEEVKAFISSDSDLSSEDLLKVISIDFSSSK